MTTLPNPLFILVVLCANIALSEWLARRTFARHLGTTLLVMVVTAVIANLGVIPTSAKTPIYGAILTYVTPLAIFWLLLRVNLRDVLQAGLPMVGLFLVGSAGTAMGVVLATWAVGGSESIGESYRAIGGIFVGTYTGGAVNFNALALHYGVNRQPAVFAGITAVDNILTTVWMVATIAIPLAVTRLWPRAQCPGGHRSESGPQCPGHLTGLHNSAAASRTGLLESGSKAAEVDTDSLHQVDVAILLGAACLTLRVSDVAADWLLNNYGIDCPSIVVLTTLALLLAQLKPVQRWRGSQVLGMFSMYLFLAVIGASCDVAAFRQIGPLGLTIFLFAALVIATHAAVTFGTAALLRIDPDIAAIASQANIGGATTALGVARSLRRNDLAVPAVLVGSLGYAIGTYLGFAVAEYVL